MIIVSSLAVHDEATVPKLNSLLPPAIRVHAVRRVTKNFNSKNSCDARTYLYLTPTFSFAPLEGGPTTEEYRIDGETRERVNEVLKKYVGSHFYHNYTSGK